MSLKVVTRRPKVVSKPRGQGGCHECMQAGCLECKVGALPLQPRLSEAGGRLGVYGGSNEGPADSLSSRCVGCAPDSISYFNLSLFNPSTSLQAIPAQIVDTRSTAIIDTPDNWDMSIVRFDVSAQLLPPMILPMSPLPPPPPAAQPPTTPSLLSVTLTFGGVDHLAPVLLPFNGPQIYGYVFSFDELVTDINAAFATAFAAIVGPPVGASPPFLYFDPDTQMFRLVFQTADYGVAPLIEIWVNTNLYKYIDSMPAFFAGLGVVTGKDFRIQVERASAVLIPTPPGPGFPVLIQGYTGALAYVTQAGPSLASTNGVRSIFITSNLLPINPEGLPTTNAIGQNANYSSNSTPILSDFLLSTDPAANPVVDRISVSYLPTAEYRMIQLRGRSPIKQVDIKFFFTLFDGTVKELFLFPGGFCSVKILFRRSARSTLRDASGGAAI